MFLNNLITKVVKRSVVRFGVLDELIHRQNLKRCHGRGCGDSSENIAQLRQAFLLPLNYTHGWIKEYFDVTAFMIHVCLCRLLGTSQTVGSTKLEKVMTHDLGLFVACSPSFSLSEDQIHFVHSGNSRWVFGLGKLLY